MIKNLIQSFGINGNRSALGRYPNRINHIIVSAEKFADMYKRNPSLVSGAELVVPKLGDGILPQYRIPNNLDFVDITEATVYESAE